MPLRIFKYILRICDEHRKKHPKAKLPVIYPMIYYTGSSPYNASTSIFDLFDDKELARTTLLSPIQLIDLNKIDDKELRNQVYVHIMLLAHKYAAGKREMEFLDLVRKIFDFPDETQIIDLNICKDVVSHLLYIGDSLDENTEEIIQEVSSLLPAEIKEEVVSIAERLIEQGLQQGLQQGMQQGMERGMQQGMQQGIQRIHRVCIRLLDEGLDLQFISEATGLSPEEIQEIRLKRTN